jgi:hypothetical protein
MMRTAKYQNLLALLIIPTLLASAGVRAHDDIPDITGYWNGMLHEEYRIRLWGPEPDEIEGLPLNPNGVKTQENFDPDYYYKPENQCRHHGGGYVMRGPFARHFIYDEEDENILYIHIELEAQTRTIYLDGRPPPSEEHTSLGHSVGTWENGILTVITTHMTPYFHRRNGVPYSENAHMTEYFIMHDDEYLTLISKIVDPEYLYEPLVRSLTYKKLPDSYEKQFYFEYDCEVVEWEGGNPAGGIKQN